MTTRRARRTPTLLWFVARQPLTRAALATAPAAGLVVFVLRDHPSPPAAMAFGWVLAAVVAGATARGWSSRYDVVGTRAEDAFLALPLRGTTLWAAHLVALFIWLAVPLASTLLALLVLGRAGTEPLWLYGARWFDAIVLVLAVLGVVAPRRASIDVTFPRGVAVVAGVGCAMILARSTSPAAHLVAAIASAALLARGASRSRPSLLYEPAPPDGIDRSEPREQPAERGPRPERTGGSRLLSHPLLRLGSFAPGWTGWMVLLFSMTSGPAYRGGLFGAGLFAAWMLVAGTTAVAREIPHLPVPPRVVVGSVALRLAGFAALGRFVAWILHQRATAPANDAWFVLAIGLVIGTGMSWLVDRRHVDGDEPSEKLTAVASMLLGLVAVVGVDFFGRDVALPHLPASLGVPLAVVALVPALALAWWRAAHHRDGATGSGSASWITFRGSSSQS